MNNTTDRIKNVLITLTVVGLSLIFYFVLSKKINDPVYTIGLVYPATLAFHEQANQKLKEIVASDKRFKIIEYTIAGRDQLLANNICSKALAEPVDLFVATGLMCSQTMVKLAQKRAVSKPIVFFGVHNPVDLGLIDSIEKPGKNVTGLFVESAVQQLSPIELVFLFKPNVKSILLPYAINEHANTDALHKMKNICVRKGVALNLLPIDMVGETLIRVVSKIQGTDLLMYIEPDAISSYGSGMGKIASQHGVTMFASSQDGILDSAVAYSSDSRIFAFHVFELVKRILINHESPAVIPAQLMDGNRSLIINTALCAQQDLKDIDIERIVHTINTDPQFAVVRDHLIIQ